MRSRKTSQTRAVPARRRELRRPPAVPYRSLPADAESLEEAERRRRRRCRILRRGGVKSKLLADRLDQCRPNARCSSVADPVCMLNERAWFCDGLSHVWAKNSAIRVVTILPADTRIAGKRLESFDVDRFFNTTRKRFGRLRLSGISMIGGIDVAFEAADNSWHFHLHLAVIGTDEKTLGDGIRRIRKLYPVTPEISRPMVTQKLRDLDQITYLLKGRWERRERWSKGNKKSCTDERIKGPQLRTLLRFWDRYHPQDLIFLFGARRRRDGRFDLCPKVIVNQATPPLKRGRPQ